MTTGEKLAVLRKKKNLTQEQLAEVLGVTRQSVSRWEMDVAFPETEKLIKLSRLLECSIDFLLDDDIKEYGEDNENVSVKDCCKFIRECGYFFLATAFEDKPKLRPMGIIYSDDKSLFITTDKRKNVYVDIINNPQIELASYNMNSRRWIRINGKAKVESSNRIKQEIREMYPMLSQEYIDQEEIFLAIFKVTIDSVSIY